MAYAVEKSGWSKELTDLHNEEAGGHHPMDVASRRLAIRTIRKYVSGAPPVILDIGCSSGYLLDDLKVAFPGAGIVGADFLHSIVELVARRHRDIPLLQFDLRHCPLPAECCDGVVALNVLEHIDDDALAVRELARILKPGGIVHIEVPSGSHLFDVSDEYLGHYRRYDMSTIIARLNQAGLRVLKAQYLGSFLYPGFAWMKRHNRHLTGCKEEEKAQLVANQIRRTRTKFVLGALLSLEASIARFLSLPFGIRCVLVGWKPKS